MPMKLKTVEIDGKHYAEVQDGKPVFVHDDGKEIPFDAQQAMDKIGSLNGEARGHRERAEAAEAKFKAFEGIDDPAAAIKALQTVQNLDAKKLVDAGEVERIREEAIKATTAKYEPIVKERDSLQSALVGEKIGGSFARSKLIADKLAIPPDMAEAAFGKHFKLVDNQVVAHYGDGKQIFSRVKPGELAGFDEALEIIIDAYPHRDTILRGSGAAGGGASNTGGGGAGGKAITREQFDSMPLAQRNEHFSKGGTITD